MPGGQHEQPKATSNEEPSKEIVISMWSAAEEPRNGTGPRATEEELTGGHRRKAARRSARARAFAMCDACDASAAAAAATSTSALCSAAAAAAAAAEDDMGGGGGWAVPDGGAGASPRPCAPQQCAIVSKK